MVKILKKPLYLLAATSIFTQACAPMLQNVKEESEVAAAVPKSYPVFVSEDLTVVDDESKQNSVGSPAANSDPNGAKPAEGVTKPDATTSAKSDAPAQDPITASDATPLNNSLEKSSTTAPNATPAATPAANSNTPSSPMAPGESNPPAVSAAPAKEDPGSVEQSWKMFFKDPALASLIAIGLENNQDLKMVNQEINIANNEVSARSGEYLPKLGLGGRAQVEKVGDLTSQGVSDATSEYEPGKRVPEVLHNYSLGLAMSWELDIWKKLRNATQSALLRYMSTIDGRNFRVTELVAEIANSYYELLSYDSQLEFVKDNITFQLQALNLIRMQMQAARVTSLPVKRFEAEVLKNRGRLFELKQKVVVAENRINFLLGRFPQPIARPSTKFINLAPRQVTFGVPSELLSRRPDVRQAELKLQATKLDVKVARALFYPSLSIEAGVGYEAFNSKHLFKPESLFYNLAGNLTAPLLNRRGIKAEYLSANSKQIQAVYDYERTVINAYTEVVNQLSMIENNRKELDLKTQQVAALNEAVDISTILYKAARADYVEVLMTRRDTLDAEMELMEVKKNQLSAYVNLYKSLGGGWRQ